MNENLNESQKKPGVVIFAMILNFFSAAFWLVASMFLLLVGNAGMSTIAQDKNLGRVATIFMASTYFIYTFFVLLILFHIFLGIGLLMGKKLAWYFQVISCVTGIVTFFWLPPSLIISIVILIFFFMSNVRSYFKI